MKKYFTLLLALITALTLCLSGCNKTPETPTPQPPAPEQPAPETPTPETPTPETPTPETPSEVVDTYKGAVSAETYASKDETVEGFLATELSSGSSVAEFVDYTAEEQLTSEQTNELEISSDYREGLLSVEKGKIEYRESSASSAVRAFAVAARAGASKAAGEDDKTFFKTIYILSYADAYRFFTPAPEAGEAITKSYFDSTFDPESYINCTMLGTIIQAGKEMNELIRVTEDLLLELVDIETEGKSGGYVFETETGLDAVLCSKGPNDEKFEYMLDDSGYASELEGMTVKEYFIQTFKSKFGQADYTFFVKTEKGYELRADKHEALLQSMGYNPENDNIDIEEYVVNIIGGRISNIRMKFTDDSIMHQGDISEFDIALSDFGTTVIDVPAEVDEIIANYKSSHTNE